MYQLSLRGLVREVRINKQYRDHDHVRHHGRAVLHGHHRENQQSLLLEQTIFLDWRVYLRLWKRREHQGNYRGLCLRCLDPWNLKTEKKVRHWSKTIEDAAGTHRWWEERPAC